MKKSRLSLDLQFDFDLIGIITPVKEYKLAWILNECSECQFVKAEDIKIDFVNLKNITISNFIFETEHVNFRLLKNRLVFNNALSDRYLLPKLRDFDYFIKIDGLKDLYPTDAIVKALKNNNLIQYTITLDPIKLKQKENLIF